MVADLYETLLTEVGGILGVTLFPDGNNSCLVKLKNGLRVQMEMERSSKFFLIGIDLGPVPSGQYRQKLFREALRANGLPYPRLGILAFSEKSGHLILFDPISVQDLNGERIAFRLSPLTEKALKWQEAIQRNEVPIVETPVKGGVRPPAGVFGLRP